MEAEIESWVERRAEKKGLKKKIIMHILLVQAQLDRSNYIRSVSMVLLILNISLQILEKLDLGPRRSLCRELTRTGLLPAYSVITVLSGILTTIFVLVSSLTEWGTQFVKKSLKSPKSSLLVQTYTILLLLNYTIIGPVSVAIYTSELSSNGESSFWIWISLVPSVVCIIQAILYPALCISPIYSRDAFGASNRLPLGVLIAGLAYTLVMGVINKDIYPVRQNTAGTTYIMLEALQTVFYGGALFLSFNSTVFHSKSAGRVIQIGLYMVVISIAYSVAWAYLHNRFRGMQSVTFYCFVAGGIRLIANANTLRSIVNLEKRQPTKSNILQILQLSVAHSREIKVPPEYWVTVNSKVAWNLHSSHEHNTTTTPYLTTIGAPLMTTGGGKKKGASKITVQREIPSQRRLDPPQIQLPDHEPNEGLGIEDQIVDTQEAGLVDNKGKAYVAHLFTAAFSKSSIFDFELGIHFARYLIFTGSNITNLGIILNKIRQQAKSINALIISARLENLAAQLILEIEKGRNKKDSMSESGTPFIRRSQAIIDGESLDIYKPIQAIHKYIQLAQLMRQQIGQISEFYDLLDHPHVAVAKIHSLMSDVREDRESCQILFNSVEKASGPHQTFHLLPYASFIELTQNNYEQSQDLVRLYESKISAREKSLSQSKLDPDKMASSALLENSLSLILQADRPHIGQILFTSKNIGSAFGQENASLEGKNINAFLGEDLALAHAKAVEGLLSTLDKEEYLGQRHIRFITFDQKAYFRAVVITKFVPDVREGFRMVVLLKNIPYDQTEMLLIINRECMIVGSNDPAASGGFIGSPVFIGLSLEELSEGAAKAAHSYLHYMKKGTLDQKVIVKGEIVKNKHNDVGDELVSPKELFEIQGVDVKIVNQNFQRRTSNDTAEINIAEEEMARANIHWIKIKEEDKGFGVVVLRLGGMGMVGYRDKEKFSWLKQTPLTKTTALEQKDSINLTSPVNGKILSSSNPREAMFITVSKEHDLVKLRSAGSAQEESSDNKQVGKTPVKSQLVMKTGYYDPLTNSKGILKAKGNSRASVTLNKDSRSAMFKKIIFGHKGKEIDISSETSTRSSVVTRKQLLVILKKRNSTASTSWSILAISIVFWVTIFLTINLMQTFFNDTFDAIDQIQEVLGYTISLDCYFKSAVTNILDERLNEDYGYKMDRYAQFNPNLKNISVGSKEDFDFHLSKAKEVYKYYLDNIEDLLPEEINSYYNLQSHVPLRVPIDSDISSENGLVDTVWANFPQVVVNVFFSLQVWQMPDKSIQSWAAGSYYEYAIVAWADIMDQTFVNFNDRHSKTIEFLLLVSTVSSVVIGSVLLMLMAGLLIPTLRSKNRILHLYQVWELLKDFELYLKRSQLTNLDSQIEGSLGRDQAFSGWFKNSRNYMSEYRELMNEQGRKASKARRMRLEAAEFFGSGKAILFHSALMITMIILGYTVVARQQTSAREYTNWLSINKKYLLSIFYLNNFETVMYIDNAGDTGQMDLVPDLHGYIEKYYHSLESTADGLLQDLRGMQATMKSLGYDKFFLPPCDILDLSLENLSKDACQYLGVGSIQGDYVRFFQSSILNWADVYRFFKVENQQGFQTSKLYEFNRMTFENRVIHRPYFELIKSDLEESSKLVNKKTEDYIRWVGGYIYIGLVVVFFSTSVIWLKLVNRETEIALSSILSIPAESLTENLGIKNVILRATF